MDSFQLKPCQKYTFIYMNKCISHFGNYLFPLPEENYSFQIEYHELSILFNNILSNIFSYTFARVEIVGVMVAVVYTIKVNKGIAKVVRTIIFTVQTTVASSL